MSARLTPEDLHGDWMADTVLPEIFVQAHRTATDPTEIALFVFASLATVLQAKGFSADQLHALAKANAIDTHQMPEAMQ